jgi:hypothetical protein
MADFRAVLGKKHVIKDFKKCDFEPIRRHLEEQKLVKKAITDAERKQNKDVKNTAMFKYGYSVVDGHLEKVGNYNSECQFVLYAALCHDVHEEESNKYGPSACVDAHFDKIVASLSQAGVINNNCGATVDVACSHW